MDYQECSSKQTELEKLFQSDPDKALIGMIDLYAVASKTTNHEVSDGIGLWLSNEMTETAREYLSQRAETTEDAALAKTYRSWLRGRGHGGNSGNNDR